MKKDRGWFRTRVKAAGTMVLAALLGGGMAHAATIDVEVDLDGGNSTCSGSGIQQCIIDFSFIVNGGGNPNGLFFTLNATDTANLFFADLNHLQPADASVTAIRFSALGSVLDGNFTATSNVDTTIAFSDMGDIIAASITATNTDDFMNGGNVSIPSAGQPFIHDVHITNDSNATISFLLTSMTLNCGDSGCDRDVWEMPEPASMALLGIGLAGLGFASRRRRAKT